jgi:PleD family two-component response regulator
MDGSFQHNYSFEEDNEEDSSESLGSQHVFINKRSENQTIIKVLIADDNKPNILVLRDTLKQYQSKNTMNIRLINIDEAYDGT